MSKQLGIVTNNGFVKSVPQAAYASDDTLKGTIEERLTKLGFKEGSISNSLGNTVQTNLLKRQGNYVLLNYSWEDLMGFKPSSPEVTIGTIPVEFRPATTKQYGYAFVSVTFGDGTISQAVAEVYINTSGTMYIQNILPANYNLVIGVKIQLGYEAKPL